MQKALTIKGKKTDKWDFIKLKTSINYRIPLREQMGKTQAVRTYSQDLSNKELIVRINFKILQLNKKKLKSIFYMCKILVNN